MNVELPQVVVTVESYHTDPKHRIIGDSVREAMLQSQWDKAFRIEVWSDHAIVGVYETDVTGKRFMRDGAVAETTLHVRGVFL
jgi:hypothetical protein